MPNTVANAMPAIMKTRNLLIVVLLVSATTLTIWLGSVQNNRIKHIVSETHKQLSGNLRKLSNLKNAKSLAVDDKYLEILGFVSDHHKEDVNQVTFSSVQCDPKRLVVGTAVTEIKKLPKFISDVRRVLRPKLIVVYTVDLSESKIKKLKTSCNSTSRCTVKKFPLDKFPSHLDDYDVKAYKPVAIQLLLLKYSPVLWTDVTDEVPVATSMKRLLTKAVKSGIAAWPIKEPTSAFTHPKMFAFFSFQPEEYHFHHMVKADHLLVCSTPFIRDRVMLAWVQCALIEECISPFGAQAGGCHVTKPLYTYRGCHRFEMSALNLALGGAFSRKAGAYTIREPLFVSKETLSTKK